MNRIVDTLARWYNEMNGWRWASDMPFKPKGFDDLPRFIKQDDPRKNVVTKRTYIDTPMWFIELLIGRKEILRWHHIHNLNRTNEMFEEWWLERTLRNGKIQR